VTCTRRTHVVPGADTSNDLLRVDFRGRRERTGAAAVTLDMPPPRPATSTALRLSGAARTHRLHGRKPQRGQRGTASASKNETGASLRCSSPSSTGPNRAPTAELEDADSIVACRRGRCDVRGEAAVRGVGELDRRARGTGAIAISVSYEALLAAAMAWRRIL